MHKVGLKEAQKLMLTILRDVDSICTENNIDYWIESGTALGAVRYGGFIPWDDDIDIGMARKDYIKFIEICKSKLPEDLYLNYAKNDENVMFSFLKVRHKYSELIQKSNKSSKNGIFIDIFPYDFYNVNDRDLKIKNRTKLLTQIVTLGLEENDKNFKRNIKRVICKGFNRIITPNKYNKIIIKNQVSARTNIDKDGKLIGYGREVGEFDILIDKNIIFPLKDIKFESLKLRCPNNLNEYLKVLYGNDFMIPPSKKYRQNHNEGIYIYKTRV